MKALPEFMTMIQYLDKVNTKKVKALQGIFFMISNHMKYRYHQTVVMRIMILMRIQNGNAGHMEWSQR